MPSYIRDVTDLWMESEIDYRIYDFGARAMHLFYKNVLNECSALQLQTVLKVHVPITMLYSNS